MGSCFNAICFPGDTVPAELRKKFDAYCGDQIHEHGSNAYNGTLSTTSGLQIDNKTFHTLKEAEEYISNNTEKRGTSLAVRYAVIEEVIKKEPTFGGKTRSEIGRVLTSGIHITVADSWKNGESVFIPADQLSDEEKTKVIEAIKAVSQSNRLLSSLQNDIRVFANRLHRIEEDFTDEDFKNLKKTRKELKKATSDHSKAVEKFRSLDARLGKKILKVETRENGTAWLVGGWAAE